MTAADPAAPEFGLVQVPAPGPAADQSRDTRLAVLEAVIFAAEEPPTLPQLASGLGLTEQDVRSDLAALRELFRSEARGVEVRAVGGGYRMFTKPEHHEAVRAFAKSCKPRLRLSLPALETLAVVAYRQPVTIPEIQAIRGVNASGVMHTLLQHKLITTAGRKKVIGRPMLYKTTRDFLVHFGLNDLSELPRPKEMEELASAEWREAPAVPGGSAQNAGGETEPGPSDAVARAVAAR